MKILENNDNHLKASMPSSIFWPVHPQWPHRSFSSGRVNNDVRADLKESIRKDFEEIKEDS
jgi:hypothetical protein